MSDKLLDKTGLSYFWGKLKTILNGKVDKVTGKGLSANDFTTAEKNKLEGIESGAEVNIQADWNQTTTTADDYIKNKPTLGTAASKNYTTAVTAQSNDLVTSSAVHTALAGKQATLTTAQQAAVDSGINSTKVGQISTNQTNILYALKTGANNLSPVDNVIFTRPTGAAYTNPISINLVSGEYVIRYKLTTTANAAVAITYDGSEHLFYDSSSPYSDTVITHNFTVVNSGTSFRFYFNQAATVNELMIVPKLIWDTGGHDFIPYAPTNRELYEMILALQSGGNG